MCSLSFQVKFFIENLYIIILATTCFTNFLILDTQQKEMMAFNSCIAQMVPVSAVNNHMVYIYKWKNHFYEMKGDVGMSVHKKERKQEDAYTKTQTHS